MFFFFPPPFCSLQALRSVMDDMVDKSHKGVAGFVLTTQAHSTFLGIKRVPNYAGAYEDGCPYLYRFAIFDSHTRDRATGLYIKTGKAITLRLPDLSSTLGYLARLYDIRNRPQELFTLHEVVLSSSSYSLNATSESDMSAVVIASSIPSLIEATSKKLNVDSFSMSSTESENSSPSSSLASTPTVTRLARRLSRLASLTSRRSATA